MKIINDNELEIEDILGMQTFFVEKYSCTGEEAIKMTKKALNEFWVGMEYVKYTGMPKGVMLSNGDFINFTFRPQDLPHLLGLQHLVDCPILFEYSQKRISAMDLYRRLCKKGESFSVILCTHCTRKRVVFL
ncbi:MAG: hypothetical protein IKB01_09940 [Lachnospiraceae bacterium]|nr:hypothetical protein [Lachnospiraceae bacterium]